MLALTIEDQKLFTRELLTGTTFDSLLLSKAVIHHNIDYGRKKAVTCMQHGKKLSLISFRL